LSQPMPVDVLIVLGSKTDAEVGKQASSFLDQFGVGYDMVVASAHRTPDLLRDLRASPRHFPAQSRPTRRNR